MINGLDLATTTKLESGKSLGFMNHGKGVKIAIQPLSKQRKSQCNNLPLKCYDSYLVHKMKQCAKSD